MPFGRVAWGALPWEICFELGAVRDTIASGCCECLLNHDPRFILGRQFDGSLELFEGVDGLRFRVTVPEGAAARTIRAAARAGTLRGCSAAWRQWEMFARKIRPNVYAFYGGALREISVLTDSHKPALLGTWARIVGDERGGV